MHFSKEIISRKNQSKEKNREKEEKAVMGKKF